MNVEDFLAHVKAREAGKRVDHMAHAWAVFVKGEDRERFFSELSFSWPPRKKPPARPGVLMHSGSVRVLSDQSILSASKRSSICLASSVAFPSAAPAATKIGIPSSARASFSPRNASGGVAFWADRTLPRAWIAATRASSALLRFVRI